MSQATHLPFAHTRGLATAGWSIPGYQGAKKDFRRTDSEIIAPAFFLEGFSPYPAGMSPINPRDSFIPLLSAHLAIVYPMLPLSKKRKELTCRGPRWPAPR